MRAAAVLLVLLALPPGVLAQAPHEDYGRAGEDVRIPLLAAGRVANGTAGALEHALALRHADAEGVMANATNLSRAMRTAARVEARAATSPALLAPLASATEKATGNATALIVDWAEWKALEEQGFPTGAGALRGRLLLASMRAAVGNGLEAARDLEEQGAGAAELRAALERFRRELARARAPDAQEWPALLLEASPRVLPPGGTLTLRGLLALEPGQAGEAGRRVALAVDGVPWGEATTDEGGRFALVRALEGSLAVGVHVARASVREADLDLASNNVSVNVTRLATTLVLGLPAATFPPNATVVLAARLATEEGNGVPGEVGVRVGDGPRLPLVLDAQGQGSLVLDLSSLPLGPHAVTGTYAGDDAHTPSATTIAFDVALPPPPRDVGRLLVPWALLLGLVLLHGSVAERLRGRAFAAALAAAPPLLAALAYALLRDVLAALALLAAGLAVDALLLLRRRRARAALALPEVAPAPSGPSPASEDGPAPSGAGDALDELLRIYRGLLRRLAAEGVAVGPMTHRELAAAMRARDWPEDLVGGVTGALEKGLYAGVPLRDEDVSPVRAAAARMEAPA